MRWWFFERSPGTMTALGIVTGGVGLGLAMSNKNISKRLMGVGLFAVGAVVTVKGMNALAYKMLYGTGGETHEAFMGRYGPRPSRRSTPEHHGPGPSSPSTGAVFLWDEESVSLRDELEAVNREDVVRLALTVQRQTQFEQQNHRQRHSPLSPPSGRRQR